MVKEGLETAEEGATTADDEGGPQSALPSTTEQQPPASPEPAAGWSPEQESAGIRSEGSVREESQRTFEEASSQGSASGTFTSSRRSQHKSEKKIQLSTYQVEELEEQVFQAELPHPPVSLRPRDEVEMPPERQQPPPQRQQPPPQRQQPPPQKEKLPLTPQKRPIILPGGRVWRQPKDAQHEEFYQGILVAQADVLIGNNQSLNYTKYTPPKVDMTTSEVYRLIRETEGCVHEAPVEDQDFCPPISKRHFYAATLREPPPIGVVELSDL